jgi:hypothetical protein
VRGRIIAIGYALIVALAVFTEGIPLIGYIAAAASLIMIMTLLIRRATGSDATPVIESLVPSSVDSLDREAA